MSLARRCATSTTRPPRVSAAATAANDASRLACKGMAISGNATQSSSGTTGMTASSDRVSAVVADVSSTDAARFPNTDCSPLRPIGIESKD